MNDQHNPRQTPFVFTLDDDEPIQAAEPTEAATPVQQPEQSSQTNETKPEWERQLEALLESKKTAPPPQPAIQNASPNHPNSPTAQLSATLHSGSLTKKTQPVQNTNPPAAIPTATKSLTPEQRKETYLAYLAQWQQQHNRQQRQATAETAVLLQDDWLAAQDCLQRADSETTPAVSIRLDKRNKAEIISETQTENTGTQSDAAENPTEHNQYPTEQESAAVAHVHLHVINPQESENRAVQCISETELINRLAEKLRPHLADTLAGMVRTAIQISSVQWINSLQHQLLTQIPDTVDEVVRHHLPDVLKQSRLWADDAQKNAAETQAQEKQTAPNNLNNDTSQTT
ncbi:hypothetical protein [Stenoxybacter acetivorans]|uniref:hypothetical protein n=1 Tax=Stenoxybacter acetivorans TaxID=422441 RepID=UPI00056C4D00|nr:hypothetical protein [Stenoxybacter acetivorans]